MLNNRAFLIGFLFTLAFFLTLTFCPYFLKSSYNQTMRVYQIDKCLHDGQIPCRWTPDLGQMYGYPLFNYYAPLPYYLGEAGYLTTGSLLLSVRGIFTIFGLAAYLFTYLITPRLWTARKKVFLAVTYSLIISLTVVFIGTGSLAEIAGLGLIPALVWALKRLFYSSSEGNLLALSLVSAVLILSHHIAASLFLPVFMGFIFAVYLIRRNSRLVKVSLISLVLSILLASFYLIPLILERDYVRSAENGLGYLYQIERSGADFLPSSVEEPIVKPTIPRYQILTGESAVTNWQSGTNWITFETDTKTHSIIRLSQFYFPNWKVSVDGQETEINYKDNSLGLITFIIGPGKHYVEARLFDTPIRTLANFGTVIGFSIYLMIVVVQIRPIRRWAAYYLKGLYR